MKKEKMFYGWVIAGAGLIISVTGIGARYSFGVFLKSLEAEFGIIIVAPFTAYLISAFDWRTAFVVLGLIIWVVMAAMSLPLRKDPSDMGLLPDGIRSKKPMTQSPNGRVPSPEFSLRQASRMRQFWLLGFTWLLFSLNLHMIIVHVVPYAAEKGISLPEDGGIHARNQ